MKNGIRRVSLLLGVMVSSAFTLAAGVKTTYPHAVLEDKPVGYWRLGEAKASEPAKDISGHQLNGKYVGEVALAKAGPLGGPSTAAEFDGASTYVDLDNPAKLDIKSGKITIEAWVKIDNTDGNQTIVGRGYTRDPNAEIVLRINAGFYEGGCWDGAEHHASLAVPDEDKGKWVHLAVVYEGMTWRLYRNGVEAAKSEDATGVIAVPKGWAIGAGVDDDHRCFKGGIAEVAIYDVALSAQRIKAHYEAAQVK